MRVGVPAAAAVVAAVVEDVPVLVVVLALGKKRARGKWVVRNDVLAVRRYCCWCGGQ